MSVNKKHLATLLLGAAAGLAAYKYINMTPEEKEKLASDLRDKANKLKAEAETGIDKAKEYFEELKTKGTEVLKDDNNELTKWINKILGKSEDTLADTTEDTRPVM